MHIHFSTIFIDPYNKKELTLVVFEEQAQNILSGIYVEPESGNCYPILSGVAVFLSNSLSKNFLSKYEKELSEAKAQYPNLNLKDGEVEDWSFSYEWESHTQDEMNTTWGWTTEKRFNDFLVETETSLNEIENKWILDAGCGNGQLTDSFARHNMTAIGIDFSSSVYTAEQKRKSTNLCFVRGDLQNLPFKQEAFDIVVSNGVIHHTPNTDKTFYEIANSVKESGRYYIWLYSRKGTVLWQIKRYFFDLLRILVCRLPAFLQVKAVELTVFLLFPFVKGIDKPSFKVAIFDSITPRWRHYHTPEEVAYWYHKAGFSIIRLTHWHNKYGFGVNAVKTKQTHLAGE